MLSYDLTHWTTFALASLALNVAPGPDLALIMAHTIKGGRRAGTAAMVGVWTGALGHVAFAALGLSAILAASATAFAMVKWAGAAYLVWMGWQALKGAGSLSAGPEVKRLSSWRIFRQGMLTDLLNPKTAIFFLAFLPQFVVDGAGPVWLQLALHGVLIIVTAAIVEPPLVLLGDRLAGGLRRHAGASRWLDRGLGTVLVALGVKLALLGR
jgi:threonine/homoserine/homoserine lactone efflux protein